MLCSSCICKGGCLWGKTGEVKPCLFVATVLWILLDSWKLGLALSQSHSVCPGWTSCFRYWVSPVQPHAGSESRLFTSRLQVVDCSSPRVSGRGGGQISFWNFNLLQLNYLISEPHTSKEYLGCLLSDCLDGSFHSGLLKGSPILYLYPAVWMTCAEISNSAEMHCANKPHCIKSSGSWRGNFSMKL